MPTITQSPGWIISALGAIALATLFACGGGGGESGSSGANPGGTSFTGVHTVKADEAGRGASPMTTPAITTPATGSLILVHVLTQNTSTFAGLSDNMGNAYVDIGGPRSYAAGNVAGSYLYATTNAAGGAGHTWSLTKTAGSESNEATVFVVVFPAASTPRSVGAWSYANSATYSGSAITTTAANSDVVSFFGPADYSGSVNDYTPPAGWTKLDQIPYSNNHNSGANAVVTVAASGAAVNPTWRAAHAFQTGSSLWLVEVK